MPRSSASPRCSLEADFYCLGLGLGLRLWCLGLGLNFNYKAHNVSEKLTESEAKDEG